jgi:superfamily II DNA or RNA helicase
VLRSAASIRHRLYRLPRDPLVAEVLNPAFAASSTVVGAFGWFSSAWLATLAHGLAEFLASPERQAIRLVIAPALFPTDRDFLGKVAAGDQWAIDRITEIVGVARTPDADALERHAVECLGWMLREGVAELKVAIPRVGSNYHPKIWLFDDGRDRVLVRGSANATARALGSGVEHMDVDCSWVDDSRIAQSVEILNDWLSGNDEQLVAVIPLPQALRAELIKCAPAEMPTVAQYESACAQSKHMPVAPRRSGSFSIPAARAWETGKFSHQGEAVRAWEAKGGRGLIEMATGAGKTVTALVCAQRLHLRVSKPLLVVISAPTRPLVSQWKEACDEFGLRVAAADAVGSVEQGMQFSNALTALQSTPRPCATAFVVTNHRVADAAFQRLIRDRALRADIDVLHIGDEAHGLGAAGFRKSPRDFANFRLGLSATPMRQFDDEGTERLMEYFGDVVFRFGLDRAIGVCLVPYDYRVSMAEVQGEELQEFLDLSAQIGRKVAAMGGDFGDLDDESLTALLVRRRSIVENAMDKFRVFREIVGALPDRSLGLVYTSSKNPQQLEQTIAVLASLGVAAAKVTEEESADRAEFNSIIEAFKDGVIDMLVAKRVLDEGVDIPSVKQAIMLASSSVEREWIQRRGRILRLAPGKSRAHIHDIIALPPPRAIRYDDAVLKFISAELDRVRAFARYSLDRSIAESVIDRVHQAYFLR